MTRTTARWTTLLAGAAIVALPAAGFAQDPPAQTPQTQQAGAPQSPTASAPAPQSASAEAAKAHLTAARNSLSQMTQLPAASQLQGETRGQVAQLINNFNELITTQADWKAAYAKVEANLSSLLTPADEPARPSGTAGAVGTSGTAKSALDPAIRAKLVEFRSHLDQFEKIAGAPTADAPATAAAATPPTTTSTTSTTTTSTTADPPTTAATPPAANATTPPPSTPPATATPDAPSNVPPSSEPVMVNPQELIRHIEAIEVILTAHAAAQNRAQAAAGGAVTSQSTPSGSTKNTITSSDVLLNQAQVNELRQHLSDLRKLIEKK